MKYLSLLLIFMFGFNTSAMAVVTPTLESIPLNGLNTEMDAEKFLALDAKGLSQKLGRKAKLRDKIVLKIVQRKVKRQLKKGEQVNIAEEFIASDRSFNIGGFLLGFFFSLIGVLIAILFGRNAVRSALLGFLVGLIVALLGWLIF